LALLETDTDQKVLQPLAIEFNIPIDAARSQELSVCKRQALSLTNLLPIQSEAGINSILQLRERSDVQTDLVVKQSDAAAYYRPAIADWTEGKRQPRRNIIFVRDRVAIQTNAILQSQTIIDGPLILEERSKLSRVAALDTVPNKIDPLTNRAVASQDTDGVACITTIKCRMCQAHANLQEVRAGKIGRREVVNLECLHARAAPVLPVEVIA
jgi:hypothetical protein